MFTTYNEINCGLRPNENVLSPTCNLGKYLDAGGSCDYSTSTTSTNIAIENVQGSTAIVNVQVSTNVETGYEEKICLKCFDKSG